MISHDKPAVLVVDDNKVNRVVLENNLMHAGYEVTSASGGREALVCLGLEEGHDPGRLDGFDAVVLDIMMPEVDGLEVLEKIRKLRSPQELPVIMATAMDQSEDIAKALGQGSNDYITKPIDMVVLQARLHTQIALRRAHQALKRAQHSLIEAAKMESVGYLAAGVAHEVRNPLAQIQMGVEALASSAALQADHDLSPVLDIIKDAVKKADVIICDLMDLSASGQFELKPGSINDLVREELEARKPAWETAGVKAELNLEEDLPQVSLAATELKKALGNILENAIEAMPDGGSLSVRTARSLLKDAAITPGSRSGLGVSGSRECILIECLDTGAGIGPDDVPLVFDPFFTTKPTGPNTGLGLSVARKIIQLHHGLVSVENRTDGPGTRVAIHLPTVTAR